MLYNYFIFMLEMRGEENNDEYPIMLQNLWKLSKNERVDCRGKKSHLLLLQKSNALPKGVNAHGSVLFEKPSTDLDSGEACFVLLKLKQISHTVDHILL